MILKGSRSWEQEGPGKKACAPSQEERHLRDHATEQRARPLQQATPSVGKLGRNVPCGESQWEALALGGQQRKAEKFSLETPNHRSVLSRIWSKNPH